MKSSTMYCLTRELNLVEHVCGDGIEHSEEECDIGMSPNVVSCLSRWEMNFSGTVFSLTALACSIMFSKHAFKT